MTDDTLAQLTRTVIERFNDAFNRQDLEQVMALMTADCVFENTFPPPDGTRHAGQAAVRAAFADFFHASPSARIDAEEVIALGDRGVVRWRYSWRTSAGAPGHVRGVDIFRVRDGLVAEKLSYVKG